MWGAVLFLALALGLFFLEKRYGEFLAKRIPCDGKMENALIYLHPAGRKGVKEKYWKEILDLLAMAVLLTAAAFSLWKMGSFYSEEGKEVTVLERPAKGSGSRIYILKLYREGAVGGEAIEIEVSEKRPSAEEAEAVFQNTLELLMQIIPGENISLDYVNKPLVLPEYLPQTGCAVSWETGSNGRVDKEGNVNTEGIHGEEKETICLYAELIYTSFKKEYELYVTLIAPEQNEERAFFTELMEKIRTADQEQQEEGQLELPLMLNGEKIWYKKLPLLDDSLLLLLAVAFILLLVVHKRQHVFDEQKEKERQLLLAYPEIVSRLSLLLGAGMTIRRAWGRIVSDYQRKEKEGAIRYPYAYKEMLVTYYQMESGTTEGKAYAEFGKRCRLHCYRKFGALLEQNLRRGNAGLLDILNDEVDQAFEDRKILAVRLGEEAGTKLLLPMFLLLAVVLVICIAPAVIAF